MKITKTQLKQIIKEELENLLEMPMGMKTKAPAEMNGEEASMHYNSLQRRLEAAEKKDDREEIIKIKAQIEALKKAHPRAGGSGPTGRK